MGHLRDVCMTYREHAALSLSLACIFLRASLCAFVHALVPGVFVTSSTDCVARAARRMAAVGCRGA
jgi:hypothetical protein